MFDFAWSEIALIVVVAVIFIGPKDLPVAIKAVTGMLKKARRMAGEFQTHVDEMVREADLGYYLGPASARPYLDHAVLERALVESGADAAWVGWGFVAEDPAFAELCEKLGIAFVGPSADAMRKLGDKIGSKLIAEEVGVPVAPWSRGAVENLDAAIKAADEIGYPLMLKATAGGGGRGIRVITSADARRVALASCNRRGSRIQRRLSRK